MSDQLTPAQRRDLKRRAHGLEPAVAIGKSGLTDGVLAAIQAALGRDSLVKVRLAGDRESRERMAEELANRCNAALVATIGHHAIFYR